MRRSPLLTIQILCPHFERPVQAQRNEITERLVDCNSKQDCVAMEADKSGVTVAVYPPACPVFRR